MLLGTHESFQYVECGACGSIQITEVPADLARYYPDTYRHGVSRCSGVGRLLRAQRGAYVRGAKWNVVGAALLRTSRPAWVDWMSRTGARTDSRIIDVGYGDGALLGTLAAAGYRDLTGIDPFASPTNVENVRTFTRSIEDEPGTYDVVMLHHSLEHVPDPADTLRHVRRVLAPGGRALVRMPVAGSYGWRTYRENWLGLEPPRHIVIPSIDGMRRLAERTGFDVDSIEFDSSGCCYAVSEIWASGRTVSYPRRPWQKRTLELCGPERVAQLEELARKQNAAGDGDHAAYYLKAKDESLRRVQIL
jgi:SAM-dependent methyltransferase